LKPLKKDDYAAVAEHYSRETFMVMHTNPIHDEAGKRFAPLFDGQPTPQFYEVIAR
jgi:hypothetical protein